MQKPPIRKSRSPFSIVLMYVALAVLWIGTSDHLVLMFFHAPEQIQRISVVKGFAFILATAGFLYVLLKSWSDSLNRSVESSARNEARLQRILNGADEGWWEWELQEDGMYYSPRWWSMLGYPENSLPLDANLWRQLMHPDDLARVDRMLAEVQVTNTANNFSIECRLLHADGHYKSILSRFNVERDLAGNLVRVSGTNMDITERKKAEQQQTLASAIFETTHEGVVVTDDEGLIVLVNRAFTAISGYSRDEVIGRRPSMLSSGRHNKEFYTAMWKAVSEKGHWQGEIWNRRKSGEVYPELLSISELKSGGTHVTNYVGVFADISEIKASKSERDFLVHHDALTQLPNRLMMMTHLAQGITLAQREQSRLAVLMMDLDRFTDLNDSYGHQAGDELLQQIAHHLSEQRRGLDTVARLGGDEFAIVLQNIAHPEDAAHVAIDILSGLRKVWRLANGVEVHLSVSIGISVYPEHGNTTGELLQHADAALYQAKKEGRGCFRYFSENLTHAARERIDLEARLHRAIEQNELRVYFQPQVDIRSGRIIGAEALVRWQDPVNGLVPPGQFIPIAENTGLINDIGAWVLRETCLQGQRWIAAGNAPLTLAVNLSPRQLQHGDVSVLVAQVLEETGFPAASLELEITESALMAREEKVLEILKRLRAMGVRLAIDDFGTGYSSLSYLKRFPLDVLKIDKSFVDDIPDQADDMAIAAAIVAMGHTLDFKILAEGVENAEQLAWLAQQGCDMYQGYLTSPPVPAAAFLKLLDKQSGTPDLPQPAAVPDA